VHNRADNSPVTCEWILNSVNKFVFPLALDSCFILFTIFRVAVLRYLQGSCLDSAGCLTYSQPLIIREIQSKKETIRV
jgi:hypothetical protein